MFIKPVTPFEIDKIIKSLKNNKAPGTNGISLMNLK